MWLKIWLPEDHPWKKMTFKEYCDSADIFRLNLGWQMWGMILLMVGWLCF